MQNQLKIQEQELKNLTIKKLGLQNRLDKINRQIAGLESNINQKRNKIKNLDII